MVVYKVFDFLLPGRPQPIGLVLLSAFCQRLNQIRYDKLIVSTCLVSGPLLNLKGYCEERFGRAEGALKIAILVEISSHFRIKLGELIHVEVEKNHMGIVIDSPEVLFSALVILRAVAIAVCCKPPQTKYLM